MLLDWVILYSFVALFIGILIYCLRKPPTKDWLIVYFLKTMITTLSDNYVVARKYLEYPVRFFPQTHQTSLLYDLLIFPVLCVLYNQTSYHSKFVGIIGQATLYSFIMSLIELWLERHTNLIKYHTWTIYHTFFMLIATFLFVRGFMGVVRKYGKVEEETCQRNN